MQQQAMVINGAVPAVQHVRPAAEEADAEVKGSNVTEQGRSSSTPQSPSSAAGGCAGHVDRLLLQNRRWAAERVAADPHYFERLCNIQTPEYLWIGCSDSRVPANVIVGLEPGEVFVQRNVGNQAMHTDLNVMACLEYSVKQLKVKAIICCGHYNCGAVKAALQMPSKTHGVVNCWISDIRECRNQHHAELKRLPADEQLRRLCELNVIRQTFHVCTSPIVQSAWDEGQELSVYGLIYSLQDGLVHKLVGPLTKDNAVEDLQDYEHNVECSLYQPSQRGTDSPVSPLASSATPSHLLHLGQGCEHGAPVNSCGCDCAAGLTDVRSPSARERSDSMTSVLASQVAAHAGWSQPARG